MKWSGRPTPGLESQSIESEYVLNLSRKSPKACIQCIGWTYATVRKETPMFTSQLKWLKMTPPGKSWQLLYWDLVAEHYQPV